MSKSNIVFVITMAIATASFAVARQQAFDHNGREYMQKAELNNKVTDPNNISITVVYDNNPYEAGLETAWGFSCVITGTDKVILFDTGGDGPLLLENMSKKGIEVNSIQIVVLSHIHGDHTGGVEMFLKKNSKVIVYLPQSFSAKFKEKVSSLGAKIVEVSKPTEICTGVYSTGQMGALIKEQGLVIRTEKGLVVITGCAHPGIVKMLQRAKALFDEPVLLAMGGFHLEWVTKNKIENIIKAFGEMDVKYAGPCHCSGDKARHLFARYFGEGYINIGVGRIVKIKDLP